MTDKKSPTTPHSGYNNQSALVKKALEAQKNGITEVVKGRITQLRDEKTQHFLAKMSDDDWAEVLLRTACGDYPANIARDFNISPASINAKRHRDPEFDALYKEARIEGAIMWGDDNLAIAAGIEEYSSGDINRDRLMIETRTAWAKKVAPHILGDRLQIDQRTITINLSDRDQNW